MTTRRNLMIMTAGAALLTACREQAGSPRVGVPDLVLADSRDGLVVLGGARADSLGTQAVASPDGTVVYAASATDDGTTLLSVDPATGARTARGVLTGRWFPRVVSAGGLSCALADVPPEPGAGPPPARARTVLLAVTGGRARRFVLPGVVEPDAFTSDGAGLFVLEWLPAGAPDRYRVRLLDLGTGTLRPLLTRTKTPVPAGTEEEMRGAGRQAVLSPDRQILYTLYTHQGEHRHTRDLVAGRPGGVHAFVHVLHLTEQWAYCLDLPHPFGEGPAAAHALAVSPDGRRLVVADVTSGSLAHADTTDLVIRHVSTVVAGSGAAGMAIGAAGVILLGAGRSVATLDGAGTVTRQWSVADDVRGLGISRDGRRVYVGGADEVLWSDAATGDRLGRAPVPGLSVLRHIG
jgi:DNA-binding beta-propeller fold protein YncE